MKNEISTLLDTQVQPLWFKVSKTIILVIMTVLVWNFLGVKWLLIIVFSLLTSGLIIHFLYRGKTKIWTHEWMGWKPKGVEGSRYIGKEYYIMIFAGWFIFGILFYFISTLI